VSLRMTDMATGRVPLEGWGARMCNRKLRDILSNVTRRASPGKYGSAHARPEVPLWCDLICSQTQPKRIGMCYITNQSHHWKLNQFKKWTIPGFLGRVGCAHAQPEVAQYSP
jgi:hypothetical protein